MASDTQDLDVAARVDGDRQVCVSLWRKELGLLWSSPSLIASSSHHVMFGWLRLMTSMSLYDLRFLSSSFLGVLHLPIPDHKAPRPARHWCLLVLRAYIAVVTSHVWQYRQIMECC